MKFPIFDGLLKKTASVPATNLVEWLDSSGEMLASVPMPGASYYGVCAICSQEHDLTWPVEDETWTCSNESGE